MKKDRRRDSGKDSKRQVKRAQARVEVELGQKQYGLTKVEYIAAPVLALMCVLWAFQYLGTSIEWDDLFYMNLSQYTTKQSWVLNRYGHIYLQKIFFWFAGEAFVGAKAYWSFLVFGTGVLVYWCARMIAGARQYVIGLVAVVLFCSYQLFVYYAGCTFSDLTVMFLFMLATFVYFRFLVGRWRHRRLVIAILGLIFFWAIKSKETGICMGLLFLGLGEDETGARSIKRFAKDVRWVLAGMGVGCVLLMILDQIFLGDFLFSVRPSSIKGLFAFNTGEYIHDEKNTSWFLRLAMGPMLTIFMLYMLAGWKASRAGWSRYESVSWLMPVVVMFFLTAISTRIRCGSVPRFLFPAIPGLCVWGAQFFRLKVSSPLLGAEGEPAVRRVTIKGGAVLLAFVVVLMVMRAAPDMVRDAGWKSPERLYVAVILPLSTMGLVMLGVLCKKPSLKTLFLVSLCLFFLVHFPVVSNVNSLEQRITARRSELRYEPYRVFGDELRFDRNVKILVSENIHEDSRSLMLGRGSKSHCWLFNVFFNQKFDEEQFTEGGLEDILRGDYTFAFLTAADWKGIRDKHNVEHLLRGYALRTDSRTQLVLLKRR